LVPLMRAAASDPALLYTLPRWMLRGPRPVVKRTFGGRAVRSTGRRSMAAPAAPGAAVMAAVPCSS
jgi:hypothetical protein